MNNGTLKNGSRFSVPSCLLWLALSAIAGCWGGSGALPYERAAVSGTVTWKGSPLESGMIRFVPDTEVIKGQVAGKPVFGRIENGNYQIPADKGPTVGKNRVEITSYRKTGKKRQEEDSVIEEQVQFLPDNYNTNSSLTADVTAGENAINFDL
ncbi:MAG: hypothetical protein ACE37I_16110 [Rubinisphaera brasiliensis]|uniref:Carboxypeptidase regulatory-like domain-containing protein n=1 Tax=Rubinisphaera brasiliensis (strain ATCC 49424 / DSM 5305 / JCM 21570 / IAM 15109 / NBRC 103401 / IFAM 1448) TaxID=756272 RepID=F0SML5_RUBBR|nr:hypothetical protein [Rubinisphaera brasiliensis]ADY57777.1 hypothetical protein Plabr_0147 [Rubinisphaera brasiliensis DSM 5305]